MLCIQENAVLSLFFLSLQKKQKVVDATLCESTSFTASCGASVNTEPSTRTETTSEASLTLLPESSSATPSSEEDRDSPPLAKRPKIEPLPSKSGPSVSKKVSVTQRQSKFQSSSQASGSKLRSGSSVAAVTKKTTKVVESTFKPAAKDKSARTVYKSLFSSSAKPKGRRSNWITYNPYF